ncbi:YjdF family protein [Isobaculum melis]|uniref:DUF2992 family protein n=1 Tax=Isobaculum melis TaxID=142588 RepID=A0A1H9QWG5_9LACT|nr:YjdF family protein [Isobaculum melis]SER64737.1 Protein of unknown function [Isobaculum melis]
MDVRYCQLTVYFEKPFWVGLFECIDNGQLSVCKYTFGPEPKNHEVLDVVLNQFIFLPFSEAMVAEEKVKNRMNPKRMHRAINRQKKQPAIGTKSQQALQAQRELRKTERKKNSKKAKEAFKATQFRLKQEKRKQKHKGH